MIPPSFKVINTLLAGTLVGAALFTLQPRDAYGAKDLCGLSAEQKSNAVKAFLNLYPIFQEPRCVNCHGAVNPFSQNGGHVGGHIDIRTETKQFLQLPDFQNLLTTGKDPSGAITAKTIAELKEIANSRSEITDNDMIRLKAFDPMRAACKECHIFPWIIPIRKNHFVNRSAKELCIHIKTSSLTNTHAAFLRHMEKDDLILESFKGTRGLTKPIDAEPPAMAFETMMRYAHAWVDAMGGKFHKPADCGCVAEGVILKVQHHLQADPNSSSARVGMAQFEGTASFEVLLEPVKGAPEGWYRGEASVVRPLTVRHETPAFFKCSGSGSQTEDWELGAVIDPKTGLMEVRFGFGASDEQAEWTCRAPNGMTDTSKLYVDLSAQMTSIQLPAKQGTSKKFNKSVDGERGDEEPGKKFLEWISVTVIDSPVGEKRRPR